MDEKNRKTITGNMTENRISEKGKHYTPSSFGWNIVFFLFTPLYENEIKIRHEKAGDGNRTHVSSLEGWCSTIELHPQKIL